MTDDAVERDFTFWAVREGHCLAVRFVSEAQRAAPASVGVLVQGSGGSVKTPPPQGIVVRGAYVDHCTVGQVVSSDAAVASCISCAGRGGKKRGQCDNSNERSGTAYLL